MRAALRFVPLDVARGLAVAAMLVVNNPGNWDAVHPWLQHAPWHGSTPADLVFPAFVVVMGVALPLSERRLADGEACVPTARLLRRAALLIAIGVALNLVAAWPHLSALRWTGVLQRLGLVYAVGGWMVARWPPRAWAAVAAALLLGHWILLAALAPSLAQPPIDPEGWHGLPTSIATVLMGALAGRWLLTAGVGEARTLPLAMSGVAAAASGLAWSAAWPMNKRLWTGSFALWATGVVLIVLSAVMRLPPTAATRWARPMLALGRRALWLYVGAELVRVAIDRPWIPTADGASSVKTVLFWQWLAPAVGDLGGPGSSALFAVLFAAGWAGVALAFDRRRLVAP